MELLGGKFGLKNAKYRIEREARERERERGGLTCLTAAMLQEQQLSSVVRLGPGEEQQGGQQQSWQRAEQTEVLLWKTYIGQP